MKFYTSMKHLISKNRLKGMTSIHYVMVAVAGIVAVALVLAATSTMNETIIGGFVDSITSSSGVLEE